VGDWRWSPAMRQELLDAACRLCRQTLEQIL